MLRRPITFVAAVVFAVVIAPSLAFAQALAERLPADTVAYVSWAGTDTLGDAYAESHLKAVLDASNIPALFTEFLPKVIAKAGEGQPDAKEIADLIGTGYAMYKHPFAYAFTGVDWKNQTPRLVFVCDAGKDADTIHAAFTKQTDVAQKQGTPYPMKVGRSGSLVIWTMGYDKPESAVMPAGAGKALIGAANFKSAFAKLGKKSALTGYVDVDALIKLVDRGVAEAGQPQVMQNWPKVRDALGLAGARSAAFSVGFDKKDWVVDAFVDAPAPRKGLLAMFDPQPLSDDALRAIPQDAISAGAFRFDASGLLANLRNIAADIEPGAGKQIDDALAQVNEMLKMDVEKDLFGSLGSEWAYYSSPTVGGQGVLGTAIVNRLKDPAKAEEALAKLVALANGLLEQNTPDPKMKIRVKETKVGNLTIHYLGTPILTPAWTISDGKLYAGLFPQVVVSAAKHGAKAGGKSILDNPKFVAFRQRLGGQPMASVQFADLPATATQSYGSWLAVSRLVGFGDLFGIDSPAMVLPELSTLMEHLDSAGSASWGDDAGLHYRSVSPFPGSTLLAGDPISQMYTTQMPLMVSIMLPALNRAREQGNRVKSASNLRQIGLAAMLHANENKGLLPKEIGELTKQDLTAEVFVNPRSASESAPRGLEGEALAKWVREHSDYVYAGAGLKFDAAADTILGYEKPDGLRDGINILFMDGHVEFIEMDRAMTLIGPGGGQDRRGPRQPPVDGGL